MSNFTMEVLNSSQSTLIRNVTNPRPTVNPALLSASQFQRDSNNFIHPPICLVGFIINIFCCLIFISPKFKNLNMYFYLFCCSFCHAAALCIMIFQPLVATTDLGVLRSLGTTVYRLYFRAWLHNTFSMCSLLCNLAVSWDRYILVSQRCKCFVTKIPPTIIVGTFWVFSALCFIYTFFAYDITEHSSSRPDNKLFTLAYTEFGRSVGFNIVRIVMFGTRDFIIWIVYVSINIMLLLATKKHMNKKKAMTKNYQMSTIQGSTIGNPTELANESSIGNDMSTNMSAKKRQRRARPRPRRPSLGLQLWLL